MITEEEKKLNQAKNAFVEDTERFNKFLVDTAQANEQIGKEFKSATE